ncbi:extracellular solute-binding protein [Achromobacter xylosoxidans]
MAAGFQEKTGIKVDVFQATTGKVMARLEAESANPRADVLISASWDTAQDLDQRGWLLAYESPNAAQVPARFKAPTYVAQGISALGIVWNSRSGTPEPRDWSDLTGPQFKQKVTTPTRPCRAPRSTCCWACKAPRANRPGSCSRRCATTA